MFGKALVVLDADYSREVISGYTGALFAARNSPSAWGDAILRSFTLNPLKAYIPNYESDWNCFFKLINN